MKIINEAKKKKKPYSSMSITTGDINYNIRQFNKRMGTDFPGNDNNNPSTEEAKANAAAEAACKAANTVVAASPDGGTSVSSSDLGGGESSGEGASMGESLELHETVATSMPVIPLAESAIRDYIGTLAQDTPFKLGYIREFSSTDGIAAQYRGGRGSAGFPMIRIFKCTEYSALTLKPEYVADDILGTDRHTGERTGFTHEAEGAFGVSAKGEVLLQAYLTESSVQKTRYFVSIDDSDLYEIDKKDLLPYLTPAAGLKLTTPAVKKPSGFDAAGNPVFESQINRLKVAGIYMLDNLGTSIF